jgi:hypothetical protein
MLAGVLALMIAALFRGPWSKSTNAERLQLDSSLAHWRGYTMQTEPCNRGRALRVSETGRVF